MELLEYLADKLAASKHIDGATLTPDGVLHVSTKGFDGCCDIERATTGDGDCLEYRWQNSEKDACIYKPCGDNAKDLTNIFRRLLKHFDISESMAEGYVESDDGGKVFVSVMDGEWCNAKPVVYHWDVYTDTSCIWCDRHISSVSHETSWYYVTPTRLYGDDTDTGERRMLTAEEAYDWLEYGGVRTVGNVSAMAG